MNNSTAEKLSKEALIKNNKSLVLRCVWGGCGSTRLGISGNTGLSTATVSRLVDSLIQDQLLVERELIAIPKGRPMKSIYFNGTGHYLIGIDLGTTYIRGVLSNLAGESLKEIEVVTESKKDPEFVLEKVVQVIFNLASANWINPDDIVGVGMAVAGIININTGVVEYSPAFNWRDLPLRAYMESKVPYPVYFDNVSRAMALGEITFGNRREFENLICINVGYGIGAGIILRNHLFYGTDGMAGEFGHLPVYGDEAVSCTCGKKNCLTAYASGDAIAQRAIIQLNQGRESSLSSIPHEEMEAKHVAEAAEKGDPLAQEIFSSAMTYLGSAIAGLMNIFNPRAVVLGGGLSLNGPVFWDTVNQVIEENVFDHRSTKYQILSPTFPGQTALYGALSLVIHEILELNLAVSHS